MPSFTLVFKNTASDGKPFRRRVEAANKSEALSQAPAIQSEMEIEADVIEAFEDEGANPAG